MNKFKRLYRLPSNPYIGRGDESERMYEIENKIIKLIEKNAAEHSKFLTKIFGEEFGSRHGKEGYWSRTIPETLLSVLESYDSKASMMAALGFLFLKRKSDITKELFGEDSRIPGLIDEISKELEEYETKRLEVENDRG